MNDTPKPISVPYRFIFVSLLPIFLLAAIIPALPDSETFLSFSQFLDLHLLGTVGFTSELFPLTAKAIANYVSIATPILSIYVMVYIGKEMVAKSKKNIKNPYSFLHIATAVIGFILLTAFIIYMNYFTVTDLYHQHRLYHIFGTQVMLFALFSVIWMLALYLILVMNYALFVVIPYLILVKKPFAPQ